MNPSQQTQRTQRSPLRLPDHLEPFENGETVSLGHGETRFQGEPRSLHTFKGVPLNKSKKTMVGGFNPFEKYAREIGSFPQVEVENKKYLKHHLENCWTLGGLLISSHQFLL